MTRTRAPKGRNLDRLDRRAVIANLLARTHRGPLTPTEAALLGDYVREEQRLADENRKAMAGTTQALERHRAAADETIRELEQRAEAAERMVGILDAVDQGRAHGARRVMDERDQAQQRAAQAEELLSTAHQCSNDAERARAQAERRAEQAEAERTQWKALAIHRRRNAEQVIDERDRYRTAWQSARQRAAEQRTLAEARQSRLRIRGRRVIELEQRAERARAVLDDAYRERAHLLAWLATLHAPHAVLAPAVDIDDDDGWHLLFLTVAGRQLSWHIAPADVELFRHVERVDVADPRAQWDGHSTAEKYERIRTLPWGEMRAAAEAEAERFKADYLDACVTIAQMHAAATGRAGEGPERGVVEDVADVRARMLAAEEALTNEQRERAEAARLSHEYRNRAAQAEERLARIRDMADAWERRLPATIHTATAAEAVRNAANGDYRPVKFSVTPAPTDDQAVTVTPGVAVVTVQPTAGTKEFAEQERARFEQLYTRESARANKAVKRGDIWKAKAQQIEADRDRLAAELDDDSQPTALTAEQWKAIAVRRRHRAEEAIRRADRYKAAWESARRDRRADRAAMTAELPIAQAAHRALAVADELFVASPDPAMREAGRRVLAAFLEQEPTPPAEKPKPASLATPCAYCHHPRNWHVGRNGDPCTFGNAENRCGCPVFRRTAPTRP